MAEESHSDNVLASSSTQDDKINPTSVHFDPISALSADAIPGLASVEPLQNIGEFEAYQANPEQFLQQQAERKEKDAFRKAAKEKNEQEKKLLPAATPDKKLKKNVLTRMQKLEGPASLLHSWVQSRTKVKVITRSFRSVRGTCSGFVVAFDRYFNLAMVDVDETYCSIYSNKTHKSAHKPKDPTRSAVVVPLDAEVQQLVRRVEAMHLTTTSNIQHRHINQLFIRGDNVVSISCFS
ncbi:U7 snRNA-associated Sm-like protein LSm11 [Watersipora subatra]|uniref:U7 snRNA-associated Sm-like protein LSm11 n=1 Tax=Watersipora subatra TaxID=2589382 RepID=UPI00355C6827